MTVRVNVWPEFCQGNVFTNQYLLQVAPHSEPSRTKSETTGSATGIARQVAIQLGYLSAEIVENEMRMRFRPVRQSARLYYLPLQLLAGLRTNPVEV